MRRLVVLLVVVVATALASTAGTAKAGLFGGCGATAPVFAPWGDWSGYYFAPNGGFENGSSGWSLSGGAAVVTQNNEPWFVAGFGSHALQIPTGGKATINVCYGLTYPAVRFFAAGQGGDATIHVRVVSRSLLGIVSILDGGTFTVSQGWDPSPKVSTLLSAVASLVGTNSLQLQFTVESGTAQVDDLYVDPFLIKS
jgi:hypothetical protein